jgi:hypothetical protein
VILIDARVHVASRRNRTEEVLETLKQADTDTAIIFADALSDDLGAENRYVLRGAQEFDCFPFYYLGGNPFTDTRMDLEIPVNLEEYAGLRWHGWFGEGPDLTGRVDRHELEFAVMIMESPEFESLMSALAFYDMPVMFEEDFGVTVEFVTRYENLKIIIPHMGAYSGGEENVMKRLHGNENVYFTTSHSTLDSTYARRIGPERLLYASDFPYGDPKQAIDRVRSLGFSDEDEALVFGENVERLLNRDLDEDDDL